MMKRTNIFASLLGVTLLATTVNAQATTQPPPLTGTQNPPPVQQPVPQNQPGGQTQQGLPGQSQHGSQSLEQAIATCLAVANQKEVAIGKFAAEKTKNKEVREFANRMVEEHGKSLQNLAKIAPNAVSKATASIKTDGRSGGSNATTSNANNPAVNNPSVNNPNNLGVNNPNTTTSQTNPSNAANARSGQTHANVDLNQLHQEVAQQCLEDTKAKLGKSEGKEFDECYIGMAIAEHAAMRSQLKVFERHAQGELRNFVTKAMDATETHMKHAEKIMEQLDDSSDSKESDSKK